MSAVLGVRPVGHAAALVEVADAAAALALSLWLRERLQAVDIVPAAATVLVDGCAVADLHAVVGHWTGESAAASGPLVEVPVVYDGPDLPALAGQLGLSPAEVVAQHAAVEHVVAFCGFAPGFGYLQGSVWDVPRLASPRPRVEPGSVALAGGWTGIYPSASPGGWQLVGRTDAVLWDPSRESPALLAPGTRVRFRPVASLEEGR
ncbi:5-oxoprolinase subunit B family protein [Nocardioides jiangxiensis]|uniref:Carboxyltransferase domain-containing protein n=1 Tax=Nocardioides jiangxiensis TaxID=3064524 RepID=A0ABT9B3I7_9ACTN|nr:carboxyltransferase domain-containing protein [Nocardioides sp. WY-20]MDO7869420.1 carboxyltransferase domain-containing protein [Nocardioides sp. WY-20]